ncbi:hypothetical protein ACLKA6_003926 [Drosophila palustris]
MAPSTHPPERHFGYVCRKCVAGSFPGRRYACWMCIDYQLCGSCYDSGELPTSPEHKYFHPLEVHYTRAEFELYFGGEGYVEANVPQSYKCAFCDSCGFTSVQLYRHLTDTHRGHKDYDEYLSILYTRYIADASAARGSTVSASGTSAPSPFAQFIPRPSPRPSSPKYSSSSSMVSFREAVQLSQQRRNALLEQHAMNMLEELRANRISNQGAMDQEQLRSLRSSRTPKTVRARVTPERLAGGVPSPPQLDNWIFHWGSSRNGVQRHRSDRQLATYADVARQPARNPPWKDNIQADAEESELHTFLCAQLAPRELKKQLNESPASSSRSRFIEALLCSMLSEEQLSPVPAETTVIAMEIKPVQDAAQLEKETTTFSSPSDDVMDRFYRGLDNYTKWLAEFTKAKNSKDTANISAVPNMTFQTTRQSIVDIDSDVDNDTDEREEDEENGEGGNLNNQSIDENNQQVDESIEMESIDVGDDEEEGDEEDEGEDDNNDDDDEDEDESGSNSGSETSDSTIAMIVNALD